MAGRNNKKRDARLSGQGAGASPDLLNKAPIGDFKGLKKPIMASILLFILSKRMKS